MGNTARKQLDGALPTKKPGPLYLRDPGVRPSYALHSLVVYSTLTPVAQNLRKTSISKDPPCQRFSTTTVVASQPPL